MGARLGSGCRGPDGRLSVPRTSSIGFELDVDRPPNLMRGPSAASSRRVYEIVRNGCTDSSGILSHRGWIVGHFIEGSDLRTTSDVEIKWGVHVAGEQRAAWQRDEYRTTVFLLISRRFRIDLSDRSRHASCADRRDHRQPGGRMGDLGRDHRTLPTLDH